MKRLSKTIIIVILLFQPSFFCLADGGVTENSLLLKQAEQLLESYKDSEALVVYEQVLVRSEDNYTALCKASYLHCRIGDRYSDETKKLEHFAKARAYASKAYDLNPSDAESNYVMALSIGCQSMVSGPKERLTGIHEVKSFVDAALAANAQHAGAWHILGRWYFKMANLNFAEKAASKFLFGGVCDVATNRDAAEAIATAISLNPQNIQYYYDLALIYDEMKDKEACITTLKKTQTLAFETKEELVLSRRCKILLQKKMSS
jgi:regulator of microtubule dynamics protein 3